MWLQQLLLRLQQRRLALLSFHQRVPEHVEIVVTTTVFHGVTDTLGVTTQVQRLQPQRELVGAVAGVAANERRHGVALALVGAPAVQLILVQALAVGAQ